jgi:hypothetical protein
VDLRVSQEKLASIQVDVNPIDEKFYEIPPDTAFAISEEDLPQKPVSGRRERRNKMHQTSSRLLRMTEDDRPFTRVSKSSSPLRHPAIFTTCAMSL